MSHAAAEQINIKEEKQEKILAMALLYQDVVLREPDYILREPYLDIQIRGFLLSLFHHAFLLRQ